MYIYFTKGVSKIRAWWNLTKEGQVKRSFKCAIGCVLIAVLFICLAVHIDNKSQKLQKRCTAVTTGEVISVFPSGKYNLQSYLTADYVVGGVKYNTEGRYTKGKYWSGDTLSRKPVPVHYDPASPSVAYAAEKPRTDWKYIFIVLAVLFGASTPAFVWQGMKIQKHGAIFTTEEECKALLVQKNKLNLTIEEENDDDEDTEI